MQPDVQKTLQLAQSFEDLGKHQQARKVYLDGAGAKIPVVLFQWAGFLFRGGKYEKALEAYIRCHKTGSFCTEIENIVLDAFYHPNLKIFEECYSQNVACLQGHVGKSLGGFPEFSSLSFKFIPYSENRYAVFDSSAKNFLYDIKFTDVPESTHLQNFTVFLLNGSLISLQIVSCGGLIVEPISECLG